MKAGLYDSKGIKKSEIELPDLFSSAIREDIAAKYFESEKEVQPYSSFSEAGKGLQLQAQSATGDINGKGLTEKESQESQERKCGEGEHNFIG